MAFAVYPAGVFYTIATTAYFILSGLLAMRDIPAKLEQIGLQAANTEAQISFMIIYVGLTVGIGASALLILIISKNWFYPAIQTSVAIGSIFIVRATAVISSGITSNTQLLYLGSEFLIVALGAILIWRER